MNLNPILTPPISLEARSLVLAVQAKYSSSIEPTNQPCARA